MPSLLLETRLLPIFDKPIVSVKLWKNGNTMDVTALLDTGQHPLFG